MNIACSTTAFSRRPLDQALTGIANLGFSHVDLLMMENWAHINPSQLVENPRRKAVEVDELLRHVHLTPVAINANFSTMLSATDSREQDVIMQEAEALIQFARKLSIGVIVLQPGKPDSDPRAALDASLAALGSICERAGKFGITIAIETHSGSLAESYDAALQFVTEVPGLKLAYDPSHFVMTGMRLRDSAVLLPYTAHVHLRNATDGNFQAGMSEGKLDFMWVMEALDAAGYADAITVEYLDNRDHDVIGDITRLKGLLDTRYRHV